MICKACAEAGDTLAASRGGNAENLGKLVAEFLHAECEGCDCQHKLGNPHRS